MSDSLRDALEQLRENWSFEEIAKESIRGAEWCCEVGCGSGACESCPCCIAGYCVSGRDGLPIDDPEEVGRWLEIAAEHNPAIAALRPLLAAHPVEPAPVASRERVEKALRGKPIIRSADKPEGWRGGLSPEEIADITAALLAAGVFRELPTLEQVIIALHKHQHGAEQCVQGDCRKRADAARLAPAVLALIGGDAK